MSRIYLFSLIIGLTLGACSSGVSQEELNNARDSISSLQTQIVDLNSTIDDLNSEIEKLKFPADQRLVQIKQLINEDKFSEARANIDQLKDCFPHSAEAAECDNLLTKIADKEAAIRAEQERIKALGYKALKVETTVEIAPNKVTFSNMTFGNNFTFDSYDDEWHYFSADRGNTFALATMSVKSSDKNPKIPTLAIYSISGETLKKEGVFNVRFSRWRDYGSYLGNYGDDGNDFAKVSTVTFKLGAEISDDLKSKPYIYVLKKQNTLSRNYDRFKNPPVSYSGDAGYPATLNINDFNNGQYVAVKIGNLR